MNQTALCLILDLQHLTSCRHQQNMVDTVYLHCVTCSVDVRFWWCNQVVKEF